MPEKASEKKEMSVAAFCQEALQKEIAPASLGKVNYRIIIAARELRWSYTRTKDVWYADPKISIRGHELRRVEDVSGLVFYEARREVQKNDDAIDKATALLGGEDAHLVRSIVAAFRSVLGFRHSA